MKEFSVEDIAKIFELRRTPFKYRNRTFEKHPWWAIATIFSSSEWECQKQYRIAKEKGVEAFKLSSTDISKGDHILNLSAPWSGKVTLVNKVYGYIKYSTGDGIDKMQSLQNISFNNELGCYEASNAT